jgi:hypothetical protein
MLRGDIFRGVNVVEKVEGEYRFRSRGLFLEIDLQLLYFQDGKRSLISPGCDFHVPVDFLPSCHHYLLGLHARAVSFGDLEL